MDNIYKYMVCTQCITYNHAPYIHDTLNGFVLQHTSFPVVYCIIDDASTDGEQELLRKWCEEYLSHGDDVYYSKQMSYGELIYGCSKTNTNAHFVVVLLAENHYQTGKGDLKFTYVDEWYRASKYHALCEGDDYWFRDDKLQMQVDFLEANSDYVLCYTDFGLTDGAYCHHNIIEPEGDNYFEQALIVDNIMIGTLTVVYRADAFYRIPRLWINKDWPMGDFPQLIELSREGKFKYFPIVTALYRRLTNSASHGSLQKELMFLNAGITIRKCYADYYGLTLDNNGYSKYYFEAASKIAFKHKDKRTANEYKSLAVSYKMTTKRMWLFYFATIIPPLGCVIRYIKK